MKWRFLKPDRDIVAKLQDEFQCSDEEILFSNSINVDVIVTDHDLPDEILPEAFAILNPKRPDCSYPFDGLCGSGVAFKLITAIEQKKNKNIQLNVRDIKLSE